ncbi:hypothetical protein ACQJBY_072388 [Aegilops geniculata]
MFWPRSPAQGEEDFVRNVDSVLRQLSPTDPRDKFVLEFRFIQSNVECHVDQWVAFCAASTAKDIVFDFNPGSWGTYWLSFPLKHFRNGSPAIRSLHLMSVDLYPPAVPPDFCGFTNLRELKLDSVLGDIHCLLLPAFSVLEWLSITRCTLHSFSASQPLGRLRYMCVQYCHMHELEVQAPKLAKFEFASFEVHPVFVLDECVDIQEVTVTVLTEEDVFDYAFAKLPAGGMSYARKLSMQIAIDTQVLQFAGCPSSFINLNHLILTMHVRVRYDSTSGILRLASLLELAPVLEQLELHMECQYSEGVENMWLKEWPLPIQPHDHLKTVHMSGVYGNIDLLNLALHFARCAIVLELMVIGPMVKKNYVMTRGSLEEGRRMAREHLRGKGFDDILTLL